MLEARFPGLETCRDRNRSKSTHKHHHHFDNKTVDQLNFRKRFKLNIIAITHEEKTEVDISPDTLLFTNDEIVVIGRNEDLKQFQDYNSRP